MIHVISFEELDHMKKIKVYCGNCKNYELRRKKPDGSPLWGNCKKGVTTTENYYEIKECRHDPEDKNKNNDCGDYERK